MNEAGFLSAIVNQSQGILTFDLIKNIINNPPTVTVATLSLFRYENLFNTLKTTSRVTTFPLNICLRVQAVEKMPLDYQIKVLDLLQRNYKQYDIQFTFGNHGSGIPRHDVVNRALTHFNSDYIITLDDDILMPPFGIEILISLLANNLELGAIGLGLDPWCAVWEEQEQTLVHRPPRLPIEYVSAIGSATMCIKKEVFKTCNLDPNYYIGWGDLDFCAQLVQNNWKIGMLSLPNLRARNAGKNTPEYNKIRHNRKITQQSKERYYTKWQRTIIP